MSTIIPSNSSSSSSSTSSSCCFFAFPLGVLVDAPLPLAFAFLENRNIDSLLYICFYLIICLVVTCLLNNSDLATDLAIVSIRWQVNESHIPSYYEKPALQNLCPSEYKPQNLGFSRLKFKIKFESCCN